MEERGGREGREGRPMAGGPPMTIQRGPGGFGPGPMIGQRPGGFGPGPVMTGAPVGPQAARGPAAPQEGIQQIHQMMAALGAIEGLCFNREMAAMAAIAGIKDDLKGRPIAAIRVLEASLRQVRTQGLRTAIHMTLKDLYKAQGSDEKVVEHLRAILLENDAALRAGKGGPRHEMKGGKKHKGGDDDEDEDEEDDD